MRMSLIFGICAAFLFTLHTGVSHAQTSILGIEVQSRRRPATSAVDAGKPGWVGQGPDSKHARKSA